MKVRIQGFCALVLCVCMGSVAGAARGDTIEELLQQAQPWQEQITAYGRTVQIDAIPQLPDVETMSVVLAEGVSGSDGQYPGSDTQLPEKRRGIAIRTKERETYAADEIDAGYHAFGNPVSAGEVIHNAQERMKPYVEQMQGIELVLHSLSGTSPYFFYDKNAGEWGDLAIEGSVGGYMLSYRLRYHGVALLDNSFPQVYYRLNEPGENQRYAPTISAIYMLMAEGGWSAHVNGLSVQRVLEADVALCPLEEVKETLRTLVQAGILRSITGMELLYAAFAYGEDGSQILLIPVWACRGMTYDAADQEIPAWYAAFDGETVLVDAVNGRLLDDGYIAQWPLQ